MRQAGQNAWSAAPGLVFRAGPHLCALRLADVVEIMRPLPVRPLGGAPPWVRGVGVLRGEATPVVDVARLLGGEPAAVSRYVSVRTGRGPLALATGEVLGVRTVTAGPDGGAAALAGTHPDAGGGPAGLLAGVGTLDGEALLLLGPAAAVPAAAP